MLGVLNISFLFTHTVNTAGLSQAEKICTRPVWEEFMEGRGKKIQRDREHAINRVQEPNTQLSLLPSAKAPSRKTRGCWSRAKSSAAGSVHFIKLTYLSWAHPFASAQLTKNPAIDFNEFWIMFCYVLFDNLTMRHCYISPNSIYSASK